MAKERKPFILTIDDDEDFNNLMSHTLKKLDVDVETTQTPEDFLHRLKETNPSICLIDLNLEKAFGAGFQIIQAIRNMRGDAIPLIVMSKRNSRNDISIAMALGASDYISKPIDEVFFLSKIKQFLEITEGKPYSTGYSDSFHLPYRQVSQNLTRSDVYFDLKIVEVSEFGITLEGTHFVTRGTSLSISNELLGQITGETGPIQMSVHNNWIDSETGVNGAFLEFDSENDILMQNVRNWLVSNKQDNDEEEAE